MGGSGGGVFERETKPEDVQKTIRKEEEKTRDMAFDVEVADTLGQLLKDYNARDTEAVGAALENVKSALAEEIEGTVAPIFGGSVRKHTYVDGISDVDCLIILRDPQLQSMRPQQVLDYFEERLRKAVPEWEVSRGKLAVTIRKEGSEIQLLPAVKEGKETRIPSARGDSWAKVKPEAFFQQLTKVNERRGGKVVPTIKLIKAINETLPEASRLTGYHIESLAIEAFRNYEGPVNTKAMLEHFSEDACTRVLRPIKDKTGQSVHVDDYLGPANTEDRKLISASLGRVLRRMKNADASRSKDQWLRIVGES